MKYVIREKKDKKLNLKKVSLLVIIILVVILVIIAINKSKNNQGASISEITQSSQLGEEQNNEGNQEENLVENIVTEPEVIIPKRDFSPLNEDELYRFDKIYSSRDPKRVFLTFDDGPTNQVTPYILDLLKSENIKATFFVLGQRVEACPDLVRREYEEGHYIANHGYTHSYSTIYQNNDTVLGEYNRTNEAIRNALGLSEYNSLVFRFPGGSVGGTYDAKKKAAKQYLRSQGIASVDWNSLSGDAEGVKTKEGLFNRFVETAQNYSSVVVLMHDAADKILTYETLPQIISWCRENGYEFQNMYDVIAREELN